MSTHEAEQCMRCAVGRLRLVCMLRISDDSVGVPLLPRNQGRAY